MGKHHWLDPIDPDDNCYDDHGSGDRDISSGLPHSQNTAVLQPFASITLLARRSARAALTSYGGGTGVLLLSF
jgi:hypothetical protein